MCFKAILFPDVPPFTICLLHKNYVFGGVGCASFSNMSIFACFHLYPLSLVKNAPAGEHSKTKKRSMLRWK